MVLLTLFENYLKNKVLVPKNNWTENRKLFFIFKFLVFFGTFLHFCNGFNVIGGQWKDKSQIVMSHFVSITSVNCCILFQSFMLLPTTSKYQYQYLQYLFSGECVFPCCWKDLVYVLPSSYFFCGCVFLEVEQRGIQFLQNVIIPG